MTKAGKVAAGTPSKPVVGHKAVKGRVLIRRHWAVNAGTDVRALAFAFEAGGTDLIAEVEGRCARTRRPLLDIFGQPVVFAETLRIPR